MGGMLRWVCVCCARGGCGGHVQGQRQGKVLVKTKTEMALQARYRFQHL
jgi:hypothetical protein